MPTTTCKGVVLYVDQIPPRIPLVHNEADPVGPDGKEGKFEGDGLPGGGDENGETLFETVMREVCLEAGIIIKIEKDPESGRKMPTICGPCEEGAFLCEPKPWVDNTVYTFLLEPATNELGVVSEINETGSVRFSTLGNILMMPLAMKKIRYSDGSVEVRRNSAGIYFKDRERIVATLHVAGKNFCELVPNLADLIHKINREEVGDFVYDLLVGAVQAEGITNPLDRPTDEELIERYQPFVGEKPATDPDDEYRRWFENAATVAK